MKFSLKKYDDWKSPMVLSFKYMFRKQQNWLDTVDFNLYLQVINVTLKPNSIHFCPITV